MNNSKNSEQLDRLVSACRDSVGQEPAPKLSAEARARIVDAVRQRERRGPLPALFTPTRQLAVASALPLLLAAALLVPIDRAVPPTFTAETQTRVQVSKQGDRVFFTIANGERDHYVARSTEPNRFDRPADVVKQGTYVDRLDGGESLVFYRID